jgi:hypothetical protein
MDPESRQILRSDKTDKNPKLVWRNKEGHFILIKEMIHQEEITVVYIYEPNAGTPNLIKQTLLVKA